MNDDDVRALYASFASALQPPQNAAGRIRDAIAARRRRQLTVASGFAAAAVVGGALVVADISGRGDRDTTPPVVRPTTPTPTTGSSTGRQPSYAELHVIDEWKWEMSFGAYRKDLLALAESYENFSGYRLIFKSRSLLVYGSGEPPAAVAQKISEGPTRAHTQWVTVPYSAKELRHAANVVMHTLPRVSMTNERRDYSGIVVGIWTKTLTASDRARLHALARKVTDVDITFITSRGSIIAGTDLRGSVGD
jgi:hypothetical protein